jgi:regulator of replication initiation timing
MKKVGNSIKPQQVGQLKREAEKVQRILDQISMMENVLQKMREENKWLLRIEDESMEDLTEPQRTEVVKYIVYINKSVIPASRGKRLHEDEPSTQELTKTRNE